MNTPANTTPPALAAPPPGLFARWMEARIGIVPVPVYLLLAAIITWYVVGEGKLPNEICMSIAVLAVFGFGCAEIGKRLPVLKNVGAAAILATFIPSALVYYHLLPMAVVDNVSGFTKSTNFLYLFISCIIVGSILSMDRTVLVKGFLKIFVPLAAGTVAGGIVGTLVGTLLGLGTYHTFFFLVVPIMAGGVGEGAIPLSMGYAEILHLKQGDLFAQVLPPVMLGSLTAIVLAGTLNFVGKRYPGLTGEGRLQPGGGEDMDAKDDHVSSQVDITHIAAAGITAVSLYLAGLLGHSLFHFPAPVTMLFLAVVLKLLHLVTPSIKEGAYVVYKFFSTGVTYPLLFAIGVAMTPWDQLVAAFTLPNLITIVATVVTLMGTGFLVGRRMGLYPIESAVINACHSGQGGTGDVAILTAANRMVLMPFAQIATRIGGAITVTLTLLVLSQMH